MRTQKKRKPDIQDKSSEIEIMRAFLRMDSVYQEYILNTARTLLDYQENDNKQIKEKNQKTKKNRKTGRSLQQNIILIK